MGDWTRLDTHVICPVFRGAGHAGQVGLKGQFVLPLCPSGEFKAGHAGHAWMLSYSFTENAAQWDVMSVEAATHGR